MLYSSIRFYIGSNVLNTHSLKSTSNLRWGVRGVVVCIEKAFKKYINPPPHVIKASIVAFPYFADAQVPPVDRWGGYRFNNHWVSTATGNRHLHAPLQEKSLRILPDSYHPAHSPLSCVPSGEFLRSIKAGSSCLRESHRAAYHEH